METKKLLLGIAFVGMLAGQVSLAHGNVGKKIALGALAATIAYIGGRKAYDNCIENHHYEKLTNDIKTLIGNKKAEKIASLQKKYPLDQNWRNMDFEKEIQQTLEAANTARDEAGEKRKAHSARESAYREIKSKLDSLSVANIETPEEWQKLQEEQKRLKLACMEPENRLNVARAEHEQATKKLRELNTKSEEAIDEYHLLILSAVAKDPKAYEQCIKKSKKELFEKNKEAWKSLRYDDMYRILSNLSPDRKHYYDMYNTKKEVALLKDWNIIPEFIYTRLASVEKLDEIWRHVRAEPDWENLSPSQKNEKARDSSLIYQCFCTNHGEDSTGFAGLGEVALVVIFFPLAALESTCRSTLAELASRIKAYKQAQEQA